MPYLFNCSRWGDRDAASPLLPRGQQLSLILVLRNPAIGFLSTTICATVSLHTTTELTGTLTRTQLTCAWECGQNSVVSPHRYRDQMALSGNMNTSHQGYSPSCLARIGFSAEPEWGLQWCFFSKVDNVPTEPVPRIPPVICDMILRGRGRGNQGSETDQLHHRPLGSHFIDFFSACCSKFH